MSEQDKTDTSQMDALDKSMEKGDKSSSTDTGRPRPKKVSAKAKAKPSADKGKESKEKQDVTAIDAFQSGRRVWPD